MLDVNNKDYAAFNDNFDNVVNKHAPKKKLGGNHKPQYFEVNIMKYSCFKNKVNKTQLPSDKQSYKKQRNLVTKLNK